VDEEDGRSTSEGIQISKKAIEALRSSKNLSKTSYF
jgi:hypothetical protein